MLDAISLCPNSSKDLEILVINFSTVSVSIGLFLVLYKLILKVYLYQMEIFFHFFTTTNSLNWTLSKVVNLSPQIHKRLLRIEVPSSVGLESTTEVSPFCKTDKSLI